MIKQSRFWKRTSMKLRLPFPCPASAARSTSRGYKNRAKNRCMRKNGDAAYGDYVCLHMEMSRSFVETRDARVSCELSFASETCPWHVSTNERPLQTNGMGNIKKCICQLFIADSPRILPPCAHVSS